MAEAIHRRAECQAVRTVVRFLLAPATSCRMEGRYDARDRVVATPARHLAPSAGVGDTTTRSVTR